MTVPIAANVVIRSSMGVHDCSRFVLVKVLTDEGIIGLGEATVDSVWSGESQSMAKVAIDQVLAPCLTGQDPGNIESLLLAMDRVLKGNPFAKAAIEMALYDIAGKATGLPVYRLLGGKVRDRVPLKCSVSAVDPARAVEIAQYFVSRGIRILKIKVGIDSAADLARVAAVRRAVGDDISLGVDANGGWTVAQAVAAMRRMEDYGVAFAEQPVSPANVHWMAAIKRATRIPVVADESVFTLADSLAVIQHEAADVLNIYPGKNGGISVAKKIAAIAEAAGCKCLVGSNLELGVATAAMAHLACSTPSVDSETYGADIIGPLYHLEDVVAAPFEMRHGCVSAPEGPGLGVELDEERLARFRAS